LKKCFSKTNVVVGVATSFLLTSLVIYAYGVGPRTDYTPNSVISATEVNADINALYNHINTGFFAKLAAVLNVSCVNSGPGCDGASSVSFDASVFDDGSYVSGVYTVQTDGVYQVALSVVSDAATTCTSASATTKIVINGATYYYGSSAILNLSVNDTVGFEVLIHSTTDMSCNYALSSAESFGMLHKIF